MHGLGKLYVSAKLFSINMRNYRILLGKIPYAPLQIRLYSTKLTALYAFASSFIIGAYLFNRLAASGPVTCSFNGSRYADMHKNIFIPPLRQRNFLGAVICMQDRLLLISLYVCQTYCRSFGRKCESIKISIF